MAAAMFIKMVFYEPLQCPQITNEDHHALNLTGFVS